MRAMTLLDAAKEACAAKLLQSGCMDASPIKTISTRTVYQNKWSHVREDVIERAGGERGIYGVLDKDPASTLR